MHASGANGTQNVTKVAYYHEKSAKLGNVKAQCAIGSMYLQSIGIKQNNDRASYWMTRAAV